MDLNGDTLAKLKQILPEVFAEGADGKPSLDIERLKIALGDAVDVESDNKSRFSFGWSGKKQAQALANQPSTATLRPSIEDSKNWDDTQNVYIEGDNLEVLKLLQKSYYGSIKMIYIDPPYNTGKDFVYKDNFHDNVKNYLQLTGQVDDEGNRISTNTDKSGRYHTDWLNMMYPRLKLARNLLKDDGVIFISIDDNEVHNLRKICDEIFGEDNFITCLIWAAGKKNDSRFISVSHEYILVYVKNKSYFVEYDISWRQRKKGIDEIYKEYNKLKKVYGHNFDKISQGLKSWFSSLPKNSEIRNNSHFSSVDERGIYFPDNISWPGGGGPKYDVIHPKTGKVVKIPSRGWLFSKSEKMVEMINDNRVHFGIDENSVPCIKSHLKDREYEVPYSVFYQDGRASTKNLRTLLNGNYFDFPKDEQILKNIAEFASNKDSIVLDFFSGSATTAHAVMQLNAEDGGNRKYICVQLPEATTPESEAYKAGYKNICEIGKERIRRAGEKVFAEWTEKQQKSAQASADAGLFTDDAENNTAQTSLDIGFKVFKLDTSNLKPFDSVDMFADDLLVTNRSALDLFYELVLKQGYSLDNHQCVLDIGGTRCYALVHEDNTPFVLAVLNDTVKPNFALELLKYALTLVIVKDACFGTDEIKLNLLATLEQLQSKDNPLQIRII
ncbi:MAG: site-specific DNA-methyltransferase [Burkholderiales bacterium]|nr:site-specific DNA-methyltransferase [Burkholderiales bacterium]